MRGVYILFNQFSNAICRRCRMKNLSLIALSILIQTFLATNAVNAQNSSLKVGDLAPNLSLNKLLQANGIRNPNIDGQKGSVVVLEFWATWCGPCVAAIKHFNELNEKFKDKPVRFIAVTDEDELSVARFTKALLIHGWIGLDDNRATFNSYQALGLPHTVVIDRNGRIAAITQPKNVTEAVLNDLLADKQISLPVKEAAPFDLEWDKSNAADGIEPLTQAIIKPSNSTTFGGSNNQPGHFTADGVTLLPLIVIAYQTTFQRVVNNLPESTKIYKASIIVPPGREETLFPLFQQTLITTFGINVRRETRETDAFVLSVPQGKTTNLQSSQSAEKFDAVMRNQVRAKKYPVKKLAEQLEMILNRPVVDKTGLTGEYDWELSYSKVDKNVLLNAVREKLGLELIEKKQPIEMLIIEKTETVK